MVRLMGSFSEVSIAFTFSADTPVSVLSAFSPWQIGDGAPELLALETFFEPGEYDELEPEFEDDMDEETWEHLPLLHRAVVWNLLFSWGSTAYFPGTPVVLFRWLNGQWTLTARSYPKMGGDEVERIIAPLGEFAVDGSPERPHFVGHVRDEYEEHPTLIWSDGQRPFRLDVSVDRTS